VRAVQTSEFGGPEVLSQAHRAHEDLRSRASQGKLVLDVRG
jgi:hypothetical protein